MRATIISSFIAIAMIAAVFLAWAPESKAGGGGGGVVPSSNCCEPQLDWADCFCATKFGGWIRQVPCTTSPVCNESTCFWECNIQPRKCYWYEEGKVLQRFSEIGGPVTFIQCDPCASACD